MASCGGERKQKCRHEKWRVGWVGVGRWASAINIYLGQNTRKNINIIFFFKKLVVGSDITASLGLGLGFCLVAGLAV